MRKLLFIMLMALAWPAVADTVSWSIATERTDGSSLSPSEIAGHRVYFSDGQPGVYPNEIWIPIPAISSEVPASASYQRHVVVTTVDNAGRESIHSNVFIIDVFVPPIAPPKPPTNIREIPEPIPEPTGDAAQ